jgi:hypothetical protein
MFPQQPPQARPPQPQQAAAAAPPQPGQPPQDQRQSGLQPASDIGFNQEIQNIVLTRIQQTLTPEEGQMLDAVITPQTVGVFLKILPELQPLFEMMGSAGGGGGAPQQNIRPPAAAPPPGGGAAPPGQFGGARPPMQPQQAAAEGEDEGYEEGDEEEDEEEENPLLRNNVASRGLVG